MVHAFQFDSLHWHLQENNDFFWGSKRTNWFEGFLTLSQPAIICQNPWHTQQRKNKRFEQRSTCSGMHGGRVCIHKRAWTRFSQQLTFTLTPQRSTLLALFTSHYFCHFFAAVCGDLWPYFSRGFVGFFFCVICLLGLHRGSRVSGYLFDVRVFLAVSCFYSLTKKGNGKNLRVFLTRSPQRCLESGHICVVNLLPSAGELEDGLTNCLSDFQKTFWHVTAKKK